MNQKSPLLHYRIRCNPVESNISDEFNYDIASGMWVDMCGQPFVKNYMDHNNQRCEILVTETREGIDRSEKTSTNDLAGSNNILGETLITRTRESVDRSERANDNNSSIFQTIQTYTRESVDRSEKS